MFADQIMYSNVLTEVVWRFLPEGVPAYEEANGRRNAAQVAR
jgi:hypothetical protein